jgi:hypothetical protein
LCYAVVPNSSPSNETIAPTARPTQYPTRTPTAVPSMIPSHVPTAIPTFSPTSAPTVAPFWVANQYIILGVGVPAVAGFIPIFFSKQICFYALEHWSVTNRRRGLLKITIYTGDSFCVSCLLSSYFLFLFVSVYLSLVSCVVCKRVFLADFVQDKENAEKKKELDEKAKEAEKHSHPRGGSTILGRLKHMKEESELQYTNGDDRMIEMTENPMVSSSASYRIEEGIVRGRTDSGGFRTGSLGGSPSFQQSRKTISFRQSEAMIDSDDETEGVSVQEAEEEGTTNEMVMPTITHPLGSRRKKKVSTSGEKVESDKTEDGFEMVVKAVYSLSYTNPDLHVLFNEGKYLTSSILSLPDSTFSYSISDSSGIVDASTSYGLIPKTGVQSYFSPSDEPKEPQTFSVPSSVTVDYSNWVETVPVFQYLLIKTILPLSSVFSFSSDFHDFTKNFSALLENKLVLIVSHWVVGCSYSFCYHRSEQFQVRRWLLPTWKTLLFGARLLAVHSLSHWKDSSIVATSPSSFSSSDVKYCTSLSSIYSIHSVASCVSTFSPTSLLSFSSLTQCLSTDLPIKLLSSSSECYLLMQNHHAASSDLFSFLPSFLGAGYLGAKIVFSGPLSSPFFSFVSVFRTTMFVDYISRLVISSMPSFSEQLNCEGLFDILTYNVQQVQLAEPLLDREM